MSGQSITIASGIILLVLFSLVGWNLERKGSRQLADEKERRHDPRWMK